MPVYEYIEVATGETVEFCVPIKRRDKVKGHKRITVPRRLNVVVGALDPQSADKAVPKAFRQVEETVPSDRIERETGYSVEHIKRVWDFN